jgi:L-fuconolactonase
METVDTHAHIYHSDESAYPMMDDALRPPPGTGSIEHLREEVRKAGVTRVVLVQTGSAYRWDNRLLSDTAAENREWTAGVCTLDPASRASGQELERLVSDYNVRGVRMEPTGQRYPLLYQPGAVHIWETVRRLGAVVCAHIRASFLRQLSDLLARFPEVPVVLDHAAYPKAADGVQSDTVQGVLELSRFRNLSVKLTFAVSGSDEAYPFRDVHPIIRALIDGFGPERCMWGSDFPCEHWLKKASYAQHLALFTEEMGLSEGEKQAILEETPTRIWFG